MKLKRVVEICHVRSAIYRKSNPNKLYWKNHFISLEKRIHFWDKFANDWEEYDPRDNDNTSIYG